MGKNNKVKEALKDAGKTITAKELRAIQEQYGSKAVEKAQDYARNTPGVSLNTQAKAFTPLVTAATPVATNVSRADVRDFIQKKDFGNTIGAKDLRAINEKFGEQGVLAAQRIAENSKSTDFNKNAKDYYKTFVAQPSDTGGINTSSAAVSDFSSSTAPTASGDEVVSYATYDLAKDAGIANIERAGAYERLKYEVDNRIPLAQTEISGKLDLQKIVNSGYKEISQIERASKMMGNITSMFNF